MSEPVYPTETKLQLMFSGSSDFVTITSDIIAEDGISLNYGIPSDRPDQRIASGGTLEFTLDNSVLNSGGINGYYSPRSSDCRSGFQEGIEARLLVNYDSDDYGIWQGYLTKIDPETGEAGPRTVKCTCKDYLGIATSLKPRGLDLKADQTGDQLVTAAVAACDRQPPGYVYGTGKSTFAYAFDEIRDGYTTLYQILKNIAISEYGYIYMASGTPDSDGQGYYNLIFQNRHERITTSDILISMDQDGDSDDYQLLDVDADEASVFNTALFTTFPRAVGTDSDAILWQYEGDAPPIAVDETITIYGRYTDPTGRSAKIAGSEIIELVPSCDIVFSGGNDSDIITSDSILGGNTAKIIMQNNSGVSGSITHLQVRGTPVTVYQPVIVESYDTASIMDHGERLITLNPPYQDNPLEGQDFADITITWFKDRVTKAKSVSFIANKNHIQMLAGLKGTVGKRITLAEKLTEISGDNFIQAVKMDIKDNQIIKVGWGLTEAAATSFWILGTSKLDTETILGF